MTVAELIKRLQVVPEHYEVTFLCPDGYEDVPESMDVYHGKEVVELSGAHAYNRRLLETGRTWGDPDPNPGRVTTHPAVVG